MKKYKDFLDKNTQKYFLFLSCFLFFFQSFGQFKYRYEQSGVKEEIKLTYQKIDIEDVIPGSSGKDITWDFSTIKKENEFVIRKITRPDSLAKAEFPEANYIEIHGDSIFTALEEEYGRTYKLGYYDKPAQLKIQYPKPKLMSRFPISYLDVVSRDYTTFFSLKEQSFSGEGNVKMEADGYGKLRLPDTIYEKSIRLRVTQKQTDFIEKYDKTQKSSSTTFMWFTEEGKYPVLILRKISSGKEEQKEGLYLKEIEKK